MSLGLTTERFDRAMAMPWGLRRSFELLVNPGVPTWSSARIVCATVEVNAKAARRWLPSAMALTKPAKATLFIADYPETSFGVEYRESGLFIHGIIGGQEVIHCAWMVVDDDTAMILGRDLLGFPKRMAEFTHELADDGNCRATVRRRGVEVLSMQAENPGTTTGIPAFAHPICNAKGVFGLAPATLWKIDVGQCIHRAWRADVCINIGISEFDPLHELGIAAGRYPGQSLIEDIGVRPKSTKKGTSAFRALFSTMRPVGLVSPSWMFRRLPLRTF